MKHRLILCLLLGSSALFAQVEESFEGNFPENTTSYPPNRWELSSIEPLAGNQSLHHAYNNNEAGQDAISWPFQPEIPHSGLRWQWLIRYNYNPSSGNHWGYYLASSDGAQAMSSESVADGWVIGVNITGSDDLLKVWHISSGNPEVWLTTSFNWQDQADKDKAVAIQVDLSETNNLTISLNTNGYINLVGKIAEKNLSETPDFSHTGLVYTYTSSADQLLWLDNLYCGPPIADQTAPTLPWYKLLSPNSIQLGFSEPMDSLSVVTPGNYAISSGTPSIQKVEVTETLPTNATLTLSEALLPNTQCQLNISNLKDLNNNTIADTSLPILYQSLEPYDLIISEILPDPSPPLGLPEAEFIELSNRLPIAINTEGMILKINEKSFSLPGHNVDSSGFLIICSTADTSSLAHYGNVMGIQSLSSLTNSSGSIVITSDKGIQLDSIAYSELWYGDNEKDGGGWSLEIIDPRNHCSQGANWEASCDLTGGTPGRKNCALRPNLDNTPPFLISAQIISPVQVNLEFNEPLTSVSLHTPDCFLLNNKPPQYLQPRINNKQVTLIYEDTLTSPSENTLQLSLLTDLCAHIIKDTTTKLSYYHPQFGDIVINEFMADPEPSQGLPPIEYIELYNTSKWTIELSQLSIMVNDKPCGLPAYQLAPESFVVIQNEEAPTPWLQNHIIVPDLPLIPNTEASITLWNTSNNLLHWISYTPDYYDNTKAEGGWSLEQKNPQLPCQQLTNWQWSTHAQGGTPGEANTSFKATSDNEAPLIQSVSPVDSVLLRVVFSEPLTTCKCTAANFSIANYSGNILTVEWEDPRQQQLFIALSSPLQTQKNYSLLLEEPLFDCAGNIATDIPYHFQLPLRPTAGTCILNEVMYEPPTNCPEYVEIYNKGEHSIDLEELLVAYRKNDLSEYVFQKISTEPAQLMSGDYLLLTSDSMSLNQCYLPCTTAKIQILPSFPALSNEGGTLALATPDETIIESINYTPDLHFAPLSTTHGVSLERISYEKGIETAQNWTSASYSCNYQTAGCPNSQHRDDLAENKILISPKAFTPNNDGHEDQTLIQINATANNQMASIRIFTSRGYPIRTLANNVLLGSKNQFIWNGTDKQGELVEAGIYIIFIEIFQENKKAKLYKKSCTLLR